MHVVIRGEGTEAAAWVPGSAWESFQGVAMGFFSSFRRGLRGAKAALGPGRYAAGGKRIACPHCGGEVLKEGSALLVRRGMALAEMEWAGKGATTPRARSRRACSRPRMSRTPIAAR